jgi:hypothetical protein
MIGRTQLSVVEHDEEVHEQLSEIRAFEESEIRRVVDEIDNLCDEKNWDALRTLFTNEVDADFTSLAGGEPARIKADDLIAAWRENLFSGKKTYHQRGNHRIEIEGDRAEVVSKAYAFNLLESGEAAGFWEVWGIYTHRLEKTGSGWKCTGMKLDVVYQRGDERVRTFVPGK